MGDQNEINNVINLYVANARNNRTAPKTVFYHAERFQVPRNSVGMVTTAKGTEEKLKEREKRRYIFLLQPR